jgi:hypothetical protein
MIPVRDQHALQENIFHSFRVHSEKKLPIKLRVCCKPLKLVQTTDSWVINKQKRLEIVPERLVDDSHQLTGTTNACS